MREEVIVQRLSKNTAGRDFVVGDIHGEHDLLMVLLKAINFDYLKDRVICTGDLVDRGSKSFEVLKLLKQPWFFSALGNHEDMLLDYLNQNINGIPSKFDKNYRNDKHIFIRNKGSGWFKNSSDAEKEVIYDIVFNQVAHLPNIIVVGNGQSRYHVIHAELDNGAPTSLPVTDQVIDSMDFPSDPQFIEGYGGYGSFVQRLTWGRGILSRIGKRIYKMGNSDYPHWREGLSPTFCGHTVLGHDLRRLVIQSHIHLDSGAYSSKEDPIQFGLTIAEVNPDNTKEWKEWSAGTISDISQVLITRFSRDFSTDKAKIEYIIS